GGGRARAAPGADSGTATRRAGITWSAGGAGWRRAPGPRTRAASASVGRKGRVNSKRWHAEPRRTRRTGNSYSWCSPRSPRLRVTRQGLSIRRRRALHHREAQGRRVLLRVVHLVVRDEARRLVVVAAARVQVAV